MDEIDRRAILHAATGEGDEGGALCDRHGQYFGYLFGQLFGGAQIVRFEPAHCALGAEETLRQLNLGEVKFSSPLAQPHAKRMFAHWWYFL